MSVRGVAKHGATTFTSRFTGMFRDNPAEQSRFLFHGEDRTGNLAAICEATRVHLSSISAIARKGWHSSPNLTRLVSLPASRPMP